MYTIHFDINEKWYSLNRISAVDLHAFIGYGSFWSTHIELFKENELIWSGVLLHKSLTFGEIAKFLFDQCK